jgi:signal transduction histidine kinase
MKLNSTYLYITLSSVALCVVLVIQVNWILETAKMKEELFSEKANMVLSKTAEALNSGNEARQNPEIFADKQDIKKIDSLLHHYMGVYNIHINYGFELQEGTLVPKALAPPGNILGFKNAMKEQPGTYQTCLSDTPDKPGLLLKLVFPEKRQFILAEMGPMFVMSVLLIVVVLVMTWKTIMSLLREKRISEHTTEFVNNMTHEFKTPLTNIALAGRMIYKDLRTEDKSRHYSGIILEENEKLIQQVEQVLSMTALERGEIPLQKMELDGHDIIHEALKCIKLQIENRMGEVSLQLEATNTKISGDRTHLCNALCNLLDNAIKYSRNQPHISIRTSNNGSYLRIEMADRGIGIEKKYQKKVFNKFFRVPTGDIHDVKGFGLGLAYIRKIIELHEGTITMQSDKGIGTHFTMILPNA